MPEAIGTVFFIVLLLASISCQTEQKPFKAAARDGVYVFEAETFRLADADVVDDPEASGGQAVLIRTSRAFCSLDLVLPPGAYVARVRARAEDAAHDEFFLSVGRAVADLSPPLSRRYDFCPQVLEFRVDAPGKEFLQFAAFSTRVPRGESGMTIDYIEVWEKAKWEEEKGTTDENGWDG
ncbi:MAG: hypothetical protein JXD23_00530 [Spirochaetales bacterium]|nr:hypothetical protein [Spirochaetales bacterium]